jgi:hypothetical protein
MDSLVEPRFRQLSFQGPKDHWWEAVTKLYDDCQAQYPGTCSSLADYARWAQHMYRLWSTMLSAREMLVAWAGVDAQKGTYNISPSDLLAVRKLTQGEAQQALSHIERIGNETIDALRKRGIDCFDSWTTKQYQGYFVRHLPPTARFFYHKSDALSPRGYCAWIQRPPLIPATAAPVERRIGSETLRIRTLWPGEIYPDRIAFRPFPNLSPSILEEEGAMRIAFDLIDASIDTKLPLVLPGPTKKDP